jgi:cytochrome c
MDLFNSIALPHSVEHFHLLLFILNLLSLFFVPYFALLLGAAVCSVVYERKGKRESNATLMRLADDLLTCAVPSKGVFTFLGVFPALALVFVFAQLLQGTESVAARAMFCGLLALLTGGIALFVFHFTGTTRIFTVPPGQVGTIDPASEPRDLGVLHRRSAVVALISLGLSAFLIGGAFAVAVDPRTRAGSPGLFGLLLSAHTWVRALEWAFMAAGMVGGMLLFYAFSWEGGRVDLKDMYADVLRKKATRALAAALLVLPLLVVVELLFIGPTAVSGAVFLLAGSGLLFLLVGLHFVYAFARTARAAYTAYALFALVLALGLLATKDQVTLHLAMNDRAALLARGYAAETEALRASLGASAPALTGEDIYNAKCSACHLFDSKKVGPPYNLVVKKYAGKKSDLVSFILNPIKVDPAFPPMPAQGLKPAEADSIASYLLKKTQVQGS